MTVSFIPSTATFTISTHTLTWSVTARHRLHRCRHIHFNSHAHVERDFIKKLSDEITKISTHTLTWSVTIVHKLKITVENNFNSHAHVERDRRQYRSFTNSGHFNSHAHVERDLREVFRHSQFFISTHTLTWSVTRIALQSSASKGFQLTRSRGA